MIIRHRILFEKLFLSIIIFETLPSWKITKTKTCFLTVLWLKTLRSKEVCWLAQGITDRLRHGFSDSQTILSTALCCLLCGTWDLLVNHGASWPVPEEPLGKRSGVPLIWGVFCKRAHLWSGPPSYSFFPVFPTSAVTAVLCLWGGASSSDVWG